MMLIKALFLCLTKHWKQKDKAGKRYVWHPLTVMSNVKGYKEKIVALLHDIIEDTDMTITDLRNLKFTEDIVEAVDTITKEKEQPYIKYLEKIKNNRIARNVKIADLKHNSDLSRLTKVRNEDIERAIKYKKALYYLST